MGNGDAMHLVEQDLVKLHDQHCTTDGSGAGACLTAHAPQGKLIPEYNRNHSCSYRWQAHQVSLDERAAIYNQAHLRSIPDQWSKRVYTDPKRQCRCLFGIPLPQVGDWDLDGPLASRQTELQRFHPKKSLHGVAGGMVKNFVSNAQWPYFFNCHHLIPKGLFRRVIEEQSAAQCPDAASECTLAIRYRLHKAKYNINHKVNMLILPNQKIPAGILALPRHLTRKPEGAQEQTLKSEFRSHQLYDQQVEKKLTPIFKKAADAFSVERCKLGKADLDKQQLHKVSKWAYKELLRLGSYRSGSPIASLSIDVEK